MTEPHGTIDDTGRVQLFSELIKKTGAATMTKSGKAPHKINQEDDNEESVTYAGDTEITQIKNSFTGVPDLDMRACFNRPIWSPAMNMQQPPLGTSQLD